MHPSIYNAVTPAVPHVLLEELPAGALRGDLDSDQERESNREMERCWELLSTSGFEAVAGYWAMSPAPVRRLRDRVAGLVREKAMAYGV